MNVSKIWKENYNRSKDLCIKCDTCKYKLKPDVQIQPKFNTEISIVSKDTLDTAIKESVNGKTLLLNMANPEKPGGYPQLTGAQEEDLFRRTNLCIHLDKTLYPIGRNEVIISKNVQVFSKGLRKRYEPLKKTESIDIVSCPAIKNTGVGSRLNHIDEQIIKCRIETLFQVASSQGYEILVLSALGCGGYRCPPEHISLIFEQVINKYKGVFKKIIFAIFDDNYPKCNYNIFKDRFQ